MMKKENKMKKNVKFRWQKKEVDLEDRKLDKEEERK